MTVAVGVGSGHGVGVMGVLNEQTDDLRRKTTAGGGGYFAPRHNPNDATLPI